MAGASAMDYSGDSAYAYTPVVHAAFSRVVERLCRDFKRLWDSAPAEMPSLGPRVSRTRQWATARDAARLIDELVAEIGRVSGCSDEWSGRRAALRRRIERFGHERLEWPDGYRRLLVDEAFYDSTLAFFREAKAFDPRFAVDDLWQALRNVWVGNSLQLLLDRPIALRPALFAYSMLYPVTDNLLDDPGISSARKRCFNERFGARLAGCPVLPSGDERELQAERLVEGIESDFPRAKFPLVYASLLAIHENQCRSLTQQGGMRLSSAELLDISIAKGGTSVLADLFLIGGTALEPEMRFAFGYGVALQLLDDLQDLESDLAAGHETIFTRAARHRNVDESTARLASFIDGLFEVCGGFDEPRYGDRKDLIRRHCRALLVDSVSVHERRFSRAFRKCIASKWPGSLRAHRRLRRRMLQLSNGAEAALLAAAF
jgi:hypothetical protein